MPGSVVPVAESASSTDVLIAVDGLTKRFVAPDGSSHLVLRDLDLDLRAGEVVALLGRSGSGKSTLLRCIAGLIAPSDGTVKYRGEILTGANPGTAMVFQTFALLPWLTVLQNVQLGLQAQGAAPAESHRQAVDAIDLIGLDGFETAYPKELSGGMRQRVGFARALVVKPDVLLMDEPFSALDVLTAENLRSQLLELWADPHFLTRSMLVVTHNIEEAVLLADRVLVLSSNPGELVAEEPIELARPRDRRSPEFRAAVDRLYAVMTEHAEAPESPSRDLAPEAPTTAVQTPLPAATVGGLQGLVELLAATEGASDLPELASALQFEVDDLLPLVDAAVLLQLVEVHDANLSLTAPGEEFAEASILDAKVVFARQVREHAPLVRAIDSALRRARGHRLREGLFLDLLRPRFGDQDARHQLATAIDWGRYAELFDQNPATGELKLDVDS
jgi:NitT/TauT family transport system ATP-binding protein